MKNLTPGNVVGWGAVDIGYFKQVAGGSSGSFSHLAA
jgi:hypothetical protein